MVNDLRVQTGAGLLDCKKALTEAAGNVEEAITILRKKGAASAAKKADRTTKAGLIELYHFGGNVGVLIEVNCETDFVSRNDQFKAFVKDLPADRDPALSTCRASRSRRPTPCQGARDRRCAGRGASRPRPPRRSSRASSKFYSTACLVDQPFVKHPEKTVKDVLTEQIAKTGENILIRRFVRFQLGS